MFFCLSYSHEQEFDVKTETIVLDKITEHLADLCKELFEGIEVAKCTQHGVKAIWGWRKAAVENCKKNAKVEELSASDTRECVAELGNKFGYELYNRTRAILNSLKGGDPQEIQTQLKIMARHMWDDHTLCDDDSSCCPGHFINTKSVCPIFFQINQCYGLLFQ